MNSTLRWLALAFLIFIPSITFSQTYRELVDSAFLLARTHNLEGAIQKFKQAAVVRPERKISCYYNIACVASLGRNFDVAFQSLDTVITSSEWNEFNYLTDTDLNPLHVDPRWDSFLTRYATLKNEFNKKLQQRISNFKNTQENFSNHAEKIISDAGKLSGMELYNFLKNSKNKSEFDPAWNQLSFFYTLNDSAQTTYYIRFPDHYRYSEKYPLIVTLHGGVRVTEIPLLADSVAAFKYYDDAYFENANRKNAISVYLFANKKYNWQFNDKAFIMVPGIIAQMKKYFNIDDARVTVVGHSNGSTGAFSYLVRYPSPFAGFSGFNNNPRVFTGGTFILNAKNRPFYNVSTDKDYYYPLDGHIALEHLAKEKNISWTNTTYKSFPHWFPSLPESKVAYEKLYDAILTYKRNPFRKNVNWECDDVAYGRCDWIHITALDTVANPSSWHKPVNFKINHWIDVKNFDHVIDTSAMAFTFPRKSGAIEASYSNNTFLVKTSRVKELKIYISPEMVDLNKPVTIQVNGKIMFSGKINIDKAVLLTGFQENFDRQALWVNAVPLKVKSNESLH